MNQSHHIIPAYAYPPTAVNAALRRKVKPYYRRVSDRAKFLNLPPPEYRPPAAHADQVAGGPVPEERKNAIELSQQSLNDIRILSPSRNFVKTLTQLFPYNTSERSVSPFHLSNPTTLASLPKCEAQRHGKPPGVWMDHGRNMGGIWSENQIGG